MDGELQWLLVYAGGLPVARLRPDGSVESIYVYGALAHVPDLVIKGGRTYRIVHDHLGSPRLVVDVETGDIAQRLDYDIFGRVLADTHPDFQPFGFAGGLHDGDAGLVRFGARDYDPELGRWTAKDPSGFAGGDTNLYAYAYGDPVNFVDPNGELAFLVPLAIVAIKGALASAAMDAGMELASQLIENGGEIDCVDWDDVGTSAVNGAGSGAIGGVFGKAFTAAKRLRRAAGGADEVGSIPKPPTGPGSVPKSQRDPKRTWTPSEREAQRQAQGGECATGCGTKLDASNSRGHHKQRHADGGRTDDENHAEVCVDCHRKLHSP
jgi:RHS repeat-associated protein